MFQNALGALVNGSNTPIYWFVDIQPTSASTMGLMTFSKSGVFNPYHAGQLNTTPNIQEIRVDDSNGATTLTSAITAITGARQLVGIEYDGTNGTQYNDMLAGAPAAMPRPTITGANQCALGNFFRVGQALPLIGRIRNFGIRKAAGPFGIAGMQAIWNWAYGLAKNVVMLGDSITLGTNSTPTVRSAGFRYLAWAPVATNGWHAEFIGSLGATNGGSFAHRKHEGNSGQDISGITSTFTTFYGAGKTFPAVGMVCVLAGTNNMSIGGTTYDPVVTPALYANLITTIRTTFPNAYIAVSTIPPINAATFPAGAANAVDFNSKLTAIWDANDAAWPSSPALLRADYFTCLGGVWSATNFGANDVHPNDTGYTAMATDGANGLNVKIASALATF
jgi:lysophospholipase L1-like esterase